MKLAVYMIASLGLVFISCGETEEFVDCHKICDRYQECFDSNYDVSACRDRCETSSDNDPGFESKVDACESCIDDGQSCSGAAFNCSNECIGIVP